MTDEPTQSPLFHAEHAERYSRQTLIAQYEAAFACRLIVVYDAMWGYSINLLEDLIYDADPAADLHVMLATPGGDGEAALRMVRSVQARCRELTVVVPDQAKSAGTIFALGAHHILMGPTSDLGPVDPQLALGGNTNSLVPAKDVIAAVDAAERAVQEKPDTYPVHASLLVGLNALLVQQARSALARSSDLVKEALGSVAGRAPADVETLFDALKSPLIDASQSHGAVFGPADAQRAGLPVVVADPAGEQWRLLWRLWMKYFVSKQRIYEGSRASKTAGPWSPPES